MQTIMTVLSIDSLTNRYSSAVEQLPQYKFLVDGTWQVDHQQVCDTDEYGSINNIVLVSAAGFTSPGFQAEVVPSVVCVCILCFFILANVSTHIHTLTTVVDD